MQSNKKTKDKIKVIKDLLSGKTSIESMVKIARRVGITFVYEMEPGVYSVGDKSMNEEEYNSWYSDLTSGDPQTIVGMRVILYKHQEGNEPLTETHLEVMPDGTQWNETKQYDPQDKLNKGIVNESSEMPSQAITNELPVDQLSEEGNDQTELERPVVIQTNFHEGERIRRPVFHRELDPREYSGFVSSINNLLNNR